MSDNATEDFKAFMADREAPTMYITGVAGTGKTTCLRRLLDHCELLEIPCVATAYTHKACDVLRSKLGQHTVQTLHKFLKKRPSVDDRVLKREHVDTNVQTGTPDNPGVLFIDEFSMVGEKDTVDINDMQYNDDGDLVTKVVYIGDPNQLPPVKDMRSIVPSGPHWTRLTKIHRQADDNPLVDTLIALNEYINGKEARPLEPHETLIRGVDIVSEYRRCATSKILLAWTNRRVQELNAQLQGRLDPLPGDEVWSPTVRRLYLFDEVLDFDELGDANPLNIRGQEIERVDKYRTRRTLQELGVRFYRMQVEGDENGAVEIRPAVFGHDTYLSEGNALKDLAVGYNVEVKQRHNVNNVSLWAHENWQEPLAKERAAAWRRYLAYKDNVVCVDFRHATTVHKSQGSTYDCVFLDTDDIGNCVRRSYEDYLKLLYVGISRAAKRVYTN